MDKGLEERLKNIEEQLSKFRNVIEALGRDVQRPISAVRDGYYEAALTNAGSIIEAMLRDIWAKEKISGKADAKTIEQLFSVIKEQAQMDRLVQDYIRDIQLVRNRAAHGEAIVVDDCIESLRKLSIILEWYSRKYRSGDLQGVQEESVERERIPDDLHAKEIGGSRHQFAMTGGIAFFVLVAAVTLYLGILRPRPANRSGGKPLRSIAVLPLENLSGDPRQDYFADGMTEALIMQLAKISGFEKVISRTSIMQYKSNKMPLPAIGRELGVGVLMEGSVQLEGARVRINVQLIDAREDRHLWAESYDRDMRDILTLQGEIARAVARQVDVTLTPSEKQFIRTLHLLQPE
jgi:TolB-like protein